MKAADLLKLIENSKTAKSVPGELGKQTYQKDNSPTNHIKGKKMKQVTAPGGGEKRDKKPRADVGSPKRRERRSMEGPSSKARRMNEALDAKQIAGLIQGSGRDPATGINVIVVKDINRNNRPIKVPMSDPKIYTRLLQALKSGNDNLANQAYQQLINHQGAEMGSSSFRGKDEGAMERGSGKGGANVGAAMSDAQIDAAANKFSLANSKGSKEKRIRESGAQRGDSMGKEKPATGGPISKSATVTTRPFDKKPTADVGKVKKKEKRSMGENPAPVKDCKGGDNQHKSMKKMHEAKNHMGEREFHTYPAWKRAIKKQWPNATFRGDVDIDAGVVDGKDVGEWDGAIGTIFVTESKVMKRVHESIADLESWLNTDLNLMENELDTFYMDSDQPTTCPQCGARTDFDDATGEEGDPQTHQCLNGKCGFQFKGEFEPEGEFDESNGDPIMKSDFMDRKAKMAANRRRGTDKPVQSGSSSTRVPPNRMHRRMSESKKKINESVDPLDVLHGYLEAALWTEEEEIGSDKSFSDLDKSALMKAQRDVKRFIKLAGNKLEGIGGEQAGHDFWLTRNGHGAGFWDRGLGKVGDILTSISEKFGNSDLYVGDDGKLYFQ